jgi:hypothetical protein
MRKTSPLLVSRSSTATGLTVTAIALAVIILASNFTIINAQQSLTSQPGGIENGTTTAPTIPTTFQSTNDSFSIQVPEGWVIQDLNNTGSTLLEETNLGYGILAQLCPEQEEQQQGAQLTNDGSSPNSTSSSISPSICQGSEEVIYIIRYPDLDTRIRAANNATTSNNITTDNVVSYHLQKLQEVGYRTIQIINSTEVRLNLTSPQTNETITTVPAKVVEIAYSTTSAPPNERRIGYFISTATTGTPPSLGTTKGYAVFYEGNSTNNTTETTATTATSGSLAPTPLPPVVEQVFDSFELIAAPEVAQTMAQEEPQAAEFAEGSAVDDGAGAGDDDDDDGADDDGGGDDDGADDDGGGDDDGADDDGGGDDDGADDDGGGDDDGADDDGGGDDDGPDRCISVGGRSTSVTDC